MPRIFDQNKKHQFFRSMERLEPCFDVGNGLIAFPGSPVCRTAEVDPFSKILQFRERGRNFPVGRKARNFQFRPSERSQRKCDRRCSAAGILQAKCLKVRVVRFRKSDTEGEIRAFPGSNLESVRFPENPGPRRDFKLRGENPRRFSEIADPDLQFQLVGVRDIEAPVAQNEGG